MPRRAAVRVVGGARLRRTLRRAGADMTEFKDVNAGISRRVAAAAKAKAPKRSGKLANSIRGNKSATRARVSAGSSRVPYAGPIHWGWPARHITAQPFLTDTAHDMEPDIVADYFRHIADACDKVKGA